MSVATRMIDAVKAGDADALRSILESAPDAATARAEGGDSPLMLALYLGRRELAEVMMAHGRQPDAAECAALGNVDRLRAALDAEPDLATRLTHDGWTLLHLAAFFGHVDAMRLLLERGADPKALSTNTLRNTPLHAGMAGPNALGAARVLLDAGVDVNARQHGGYTALHAAAQHGRMDLVDLLLAAGADAGVAADDGRRAADFAAEKGHAGVAEHLRARGAAV